MVLFGINGLDQEKNKLALDRAWQTRNFEIEMYWKRASYFWAFIATSFGGYPNIVLRGYIKEGVLVKQKYDTEFVMRSDSYNVIDLKQTFSHS